MNILHRSQNTLLYRTMKQVLIAGVSAGMVLTTSTVHAIGECPIYALQDNGLNNTQFFTVEIDPVTQETLTTNLGPEYPGLDVEGLAIHPTTGELFATSGDDPALAEDIGVLYKVNKTTGELTRIGKAYDGEISALAFSKDGAHLWGWVDRQGFIEIDPETGAGSMLVPVPELMIEDITTSIDAEGHNILYGVAGNQLYAYDVDAEVPEIINCDSLPSEAEAVEMLADGSLLYALHSSGDTQIHQFDLDEQCKIINTATIPTQYYDIEGLAVPSSCAGECPAGEWQTAVDSFNDASEAISGRTEFGGNSYEIYSLSMKQEGNQVTVVIRANLPLSGNMYGGRNINWGDLILDFSGNAKAGTVFSNQANTGVYGVRFSAGNDSGVSQLGLYEASSLKYVASANYGWQHLKHFKNYAANAGATPSLGDVAIDSSYFTKFDQKSQVPTSLANGLFVSGLGTPSASALTDYEVDLSGAFLDPRSAMYNVTSQDGNPPEIYTISFSFEKTPEMTGDFVAYLFTECLNDGVALVGHFDDCPDAE